MSTQHTRRRALVLVDMSVEQMAAVQFKAATVVENCQRLLLARNHDGTPLFDLWVDSRLWLTSAEESSLSKCWPETAKTMFVAGSEGASLLPQLRSTRWTFVAKNNYSCFANSNLRAVLNDNRIDEVYIAGINTDYCVFATALDAFQFHFDTFVIRDAVTSVRGKAAHEEGLRNLERHFLESVLISTEDICALQREPSD